MVKTNIHELGEGGGQKVGILDEHTFLMAPRVESHIFIFLCRYMAVLLFFTWGECSL